MSQSKTSDGFEVKALTHKRLSTLLKYNPQTGIFTWIKGRNKGKVAGSFNQLGYRYISIPRAEQRNFFEHRLAWLYITGSWPPSEVDHRDRDPSNNKWKNLRSLSHSQNIHNSISRGGTSKFKGVHWSNSRKKWCVAIWFKNRIIPLGRFVKEVDAAIAYDKKAIELLGTLAVTNLPKRNYL